VRRDIDMLQQLARGPGARVFVSIAFLDERTCRKLDPGAPSPNKRFEVLRALHEAGIPTGVSLSPLIPGLNEPDIAGILERAAACGVSEAFMTLLRLPAELLDVFFARIREVLPERERKIASALADMRGGELQDSRFGARMTGSGPRWDAVRGLFDLQCRRLGLNARAEAKAFEEPMKPQGKQGQLF
jgi:DNA repair photolyase